MASFLCVIFRFNVLNAKLNSIRNNLYSGPTKSFRPVFQGYCLYDNNIISFGSLSLSFNPHVLKFSRFLIVFDFIFEMPIVIKQSQSFMKIIKILTLISIGFISLFSYGITTESIINNYVETKSTLSLDEFEYVEPHIATSDPSDNKKKIYKSKETGRLWMIDPNFSHQAARHYVLGGLYSFVLGERSPQLRLITDKNGNLMLGSEFIPEFKSVVDFFFLNESRLVDLRRCNDVSHAAANLYQLPVLRKSSF